jgi:hypothetical protein
MSSLRFFTLDHPESRSEEIKEVSAQMVTRFAKEVKVTRAWNGFANGFPACLFSEAIP